MANFQTLIFSSFPPLTVIMEHNGEDLTYDDALIGELLKKAR